MTSLVSDTKDVDLHSYCFEKTRFAQNLSHIHFFSSSEAHLCNKVLQAIQKSEQTVFIELPAFAQDQLLAQRIGHYIQRANTISLIVNAEGLNAEGILAEYIRKLNLDQSHDHYLAFGRLLQAFFKRGHILNSVIYNAQNLSKEDIDYLYELSALIYEKFPHQRHRPLMRHVFIGEAGLGTILRKKSLGKFEKLTLNPLGITEYINALYLHCPAEKRNEAFYQNITIYADAMRVASAGYPALLRKLLPLPEAPSIIDKQKPHNYLKKHIDGAIPKKDHSFLSQRRSSLCKKIIPFKIPKIYLGLVVSLMILIIYVFGRNFEQIF